MVLVMSAHHFHSNLTTHHFSTSGLKRTHLSSSSSSSSSSSLYSPKEHSVTNSELDSKAGQHGSKKATLIVAREEKIKCTSNYTKLDKTIELTLDITKI